MSAVRTVLCRAVARPHGPDGPTLRRRPSDGLVGQPELALRGSPRSAASRAASRRSQAQSQWIETTSPGAASSTNPVPSTQPRIRCDPRRPPGGACRRPSRAGTAETTSESPSRSRTRPHRMRHESMTSTTRSISPVRMKPRRGKTSSTWNAWFGTAPASGLEPSQRQPSPRSRARNRASRDSPKARARTFASSPPPSQYASTTAASSGSAMPLLWAIRRRYG